MRVLMILSARNCIKAQYLHAYFYNNYKNHCS